jgi:NADH dehydrogenase
MKTLKIALFGGTGFVGHHLCALLANQGHTVTVFSREPDRHLDLTVLPTVSVEQLDVYQINQVLNQTQGYDAVINLIGILNESGHQGEGFRHVHVDPARNLIQACQRNHIPRLIQMSALNADPNKGSSYYLLSKGVAENLVLNAECNALHVTVIRPSVIYGPGDSFLTKFAKLLKFSPGVMMLPSSKAILSPIYVKDVAKVIVNALENRDTWGQAYDLCGPKSYTLKQLVEYTPKVTHTRRLIIGLNDKASKFMAHVFEYLPFKPYSVDNYLSTLTPSVCKNPFPVVFNLEPASLEMIAPSYLGPDHMNDPYYALREKYSKSKS